MTRCEHCTDDDTCYVCMKHQARYCPECATCKDPSIYCKFRPSCIIHFLEKERQRPSTDTVL